jgi:hypothetical protein
MVDVWGSEEKPYRAVVRDVEGKALGHLPLTANLNLALTDLWNSEDLPGKTFWIDQICIDQEDDLEKAHQVALMRLVYQNAARVVTYIGPSIPDVEQEEQGIQLLKQLDTHFAPNYDKLSQSMGFYQIYRTRTELPVVKLPDDLLGDTGVSDDTWMWLVALVFGEWTTRLWMVQEQLLNLDVIILRGPRLLSWYAVAIMSTLFGLNILPNTYVYRYWNVHRATRTANPLEIATSVFSMWTERRRVQEQVELAQRYSTEMPTPGTQARSLLQNMFYYEFLQCRDPRDRMFALLAISVDAIQLGIIPDYAKATDDIFYTTTVSYLGGARNLDFLVLASHSATSPPRDTPSWSLGAPGPAHLRPRNLFFELWKPHPRPWLTTPPRLHSYDSVMVLKGRILDTINFCAMPVEPSRSFDLGILDQYYVEAHCQLLSSIAQMIVKLGVTMDNVSKVYRALTANAPFKPTPGDNRPPAEQMCYKFWCFYRYLHVTLVRYAATLHIDVDNTIALVIPLMDPFGTLVGSKGSKRSKASSAPAPLNPTEQEIAMDVWDRITCAGRTFCITKETRVCNCMNNVKSGDVLATFQGSDRLFMLRALGDKYQVIGDAYVDGLMLGEAYEGVDPMAVDYDIELI